MVQSACPGHSAGHSLRVGDVSIRLRLHLETGPIPLQVIQPEPEQRLVADLQANREGWHLRVTDANGQVPPGPLWGFQEIASSNSASAGPLRDSPDAIWSAVWHEHEWDDESEICLRAWVAAPGYVTAAVTETVPGAGAVRRWTAGARRTSTRATTWRMVYGWS